jgi:hypothetical protein
MVGQRFDETSEMESFIWDAWNTDHIAFHDVAPGDVEEVAFNQPRFFAPRQGYETLTMVGPNLDGRYLYVAMLEQDRGSWYTVTAYWLERRRGEHYYNS